MTGITHYGHLLTRLRASRSRIVDDVAALVRCESPSSDTAATRACLELVGELGRELTSCTLEEITAGDRVHLRLSGGGPTRVLLVGHCDTVWPIGTLDRWPFSVHGDRATGPGVFDMKAGLGQLFHALAALDDLTGVTVLVTTDEEIGSPTSRELVEREARGVAAALILEASADGALKTGRKGVSLYELSIGGKAAHAGLDAASGVNATVEAAHQVLAIDALGDDAAGTTVTPTVLRSGRTANTVPDEATIAIDVRAGAPAELQRVDHALRRLKAVVPGARVEISGGINRPPLDATASRGLFVVAERVGDAMGLAPLLGVTVGGASDGNFTAGVGTPTLDGLGAVGGLAHAEGEWASVSAMADRAALLAGLVAELRSMPDPVVSGDDGSRGH